MNLYWLFKKIVKLANIDKKNKRLMEVLSDVKSYKHIEKKNINKFIDILDEEILEIDKKAGLKKLKKVSERERERKEKEARRALVRERKKKTPLDVAGELAVRRDREFDRVIKKRKDILRKELRDKMKVELKNSLERFSKRRRAFLVQDSAVELMTSVLTNDESNLHANALSFKKSFIKEFIDSNLGVDVSEYVRRLKNMSFANTIKVARYLAMSDITGLVDFLYHTFRIRVKDDMVVDNECFRVVAKYGKIFYNELIDAFRFGIQKVLGYKNEYSPVTKYVIQYESPSSIEEAERNFKLFVVDPVHSPFVKKGIGSAFSYRFNNGIAVIGLVDTFFRFNIRGESAIDPSSYIGDDVFKKPFQVFEENYRNVRYATDDKMKAFFRKKFRKMERNLGAGFAKQKFLNSYGAQGFTSVRKKRVIEDFFNYFLKKYRHNEDFRSCVEAAYFYSSRHKNMVVVFNYKMS